MFCNVCVVGVCVCVRACVRVILLFERGHQKQTFYKVSSTSDKNAQCCHNSDNVIVFAMVLDASIEEQMRDLFGGVYSLG